MSALLAAQYADLDARNSFLNGNLVFSAMQDPAQAANLLTADNKQLDMLEIPGKGRCFVFIAKYSYDPLSQSPNENPEAELPLGAGDYVLVWGPMDEDGFCDGELLDGRRGLVPSNFIQKLVGDDLLDFHQSVVQGLRAAALECDPAAVEAAAAAAAGGQPVDDLASAAHDVVMMDEALAKRGLGDLTLQELEDILEEEDESLDQSGEGPVPPPKQLTLERQLHKSVLISWSHPDGCPPAAVDSYHVYVDGVLKTTVKATERPRALVEGVDSTRPHRISVRSITPNRRTSRDAACTMLVGKDVPQAPSNVKAGNVTSTSAVISWLPANSNHQHVVCVNNVEVRTVKPGVYRHTITGLAPNTVYRVTVRAKNIRQQTQSFDEKTSTLQMERCSAHIDFRTLPKGLPDPPVDIQVEAGPQDGTLLVTWLPVAGGGGVHTNGAPVTGYAVYADGKKVTDVDSPTGDHALIDINKLLGLNPRQVTVRTKSRDSQSSDSLPTSIPGSILRKGAKDGRDGLKDDRRGRFGPGAGAGPLRHHAGGRARLDAHGQLVIEPDESLSDKEVYPANHMNIPAIEITKDSASEANFSEDDYLDRRGGRYGHHMGGAGAGPGATHYTPRSHAERGRPPPLPHERAGRQDYGPRDARRDD
ncbi:RIMS-binding protein 2, partial [Gryllus bimaculatus]